VSEQPNTRLNTWLRERRRRNGPGIRAVYTRKNVISLAGWQWAKAAQRAEIARDRVRLARANLAAEEQAFFDLFRDLIAAAVLEALGEKKLAAKRREQSRAVKPKRKKK